MMKFAKYSLIAAAIFFLISAYFFEQHTYVKNIDAPLHDVTRIAFLRSEQPEQLLQIASRYYVMRTKVSDEAIIQNVNDTLKQAVKQPFQQSFNEAHTSIDFALTLATGDVLYLKQIYIDDTVYVVEPYSMTSFVSEPLKLALDEAYVSTFSGHAFSDAKSVFLLSVMVVLLFVAYLRRKQRTQRQNHIGINMLAAAISTIALFIISYMFQPLHYIALISLFAISFTISEWLYVVVAKQQAQWLQTFASIAAVVLIFGIFMYL